VRERFGPGTAHYRRAQRWQKAARKAQRGPSLGLAHTEGDDAPLPARIALPGLNIRGLSAGRVGDQSVAAIPAEAQASIDLRLVPDQTVDGVKAAFERHLRTQGYHVVHEMPDEATRLAHARIVRVDWRAGGYPGLRLPMDLPFSRAVASVVAEFAPGPIVDDGIDLFAGLFARLGPAWESAAGHTVP
jgi:acetylornithine deacetylase/succinyl-diaminopimelate desuccinylase-like protein